jgi:hypothetical protein
MYIMALFHKQVSTIETQWETHEEFEKTIQTDESYFFLPHNIIINEVYN